MYDTGFHLPLLCFGSRAVCQVCRWIALFCCFVLGFFLPFSSRSKLAVIRNSSRSDGKMFSLTVTAPFSIWKTLFLSYHQKDGRIRTLSGYNWPLTTYRHNQKQSGESVRKAIFVSSVCLVSFQYVPFMYSCMSYILCWCFLWTVKRSDANDTWMFEPWRDVFKRQGHGTK